MKGILIFEDVGGKKLPITLHGLDSTDSAILTKMQGMSVVLANYTNAIVRDYGVIRPVIVGNPTFAAGIVVGEEYMSSMQKALVSFSYVVDNESRPLMLYIPAPGIGQFEFVDGVGYRMQLEYGGALKDALRTATGIADLQFNQGVIEYRDGKSSRPSEGAYIEWEDGYGRTQFMGCSQITDIAALQTFANFLKASPGADPNAVYTFCDWKNVGIMTPEIARSALTPTAEEGWDSVNGRAVCKFSWIESTKRKNMSLTLPAPKKSFFINPDASAEDLVVDYDLGQQVAVALTGLYGTTVRDLDFERGTFDAKNLKR